MNATKFVLSRGCRCRRLWNLARCSAFPPAFEVQKPTFRPLSTTRLVASADSSKGVADAAAAAAAAAATATNDGAIISLSDHPPLIVELAQTLLEKVHDGSMLGTMAPDGLPWWAAIAGTTIAMRLLLVTPLSIYQQRMIKRQHKLQRIQEAWQPILRSSLEMKLQMQGKQLSVKEFDKQLAKNIRKKHSRMMMKQGCHPLFSIMLPLCQLPIWVSLSSALRHLCGLPVRFLDGENAAFVPAQGMSSEGILWFTDLLAVDSTMHLPLILWTVYMGNAVLTHWRTKRRVLMGQVSSQTPIMRSIVATMYVLPFFMVYISSFQPAAIVFYWILSASFGLTQNLIFQIKPVRKALGFHIPIPKNDILNRLL
ncbi:hypothetical protein IWW36_001842 [Coemansia brasiliensis]|uniref:Membrane insertase YidC/Oxa/ALB C-terminal domain-containing protein n=1 Tax=Coemansia brasiliensis TaxID=2650707 RepID=A0A9W8IAU1_9FUNG|nr:hypothetical protein IWW36_001842 [Coemansia brasiliensis]